MPKKNDYGYDYDYDYVYKSEVRVAVFETWWPLKHKSKLIRHENGAFENALQIGGTWRRRLCVFVWRNNILKTQLYENDSVSINHAYAIYLNEVSEKKKSKMAG